MAEERGAAGRPSVPTRRGMTYEREERSVDEGVRRSTCIVLIYKLIYSTDYVPPQALLRLSIVSILEGFT